MPITLAEAKVGMADKVDQSVIDMFRRSSLLLDNMTFDNCISPDLKNMPPACFLPRCARPVSSIPVRP